MQKYVYDMGFDEFEKYEELSKTLGYSIFSSLLKNADREILIDYSGNEKTYTCAELLKYGLALSKVIKSQISSKRVGLAMPPCAYSIVANHACIFAGKVPVNLNFTMGLTAAKSCIETSGVDTIISTLPAREKIEKANPTFPWTENFFDVATEISRLDNLPDLSLPKEALMSEFEIEENARTDKKEATLIFTSGSEGAPKAAILTEKNIIANCLQTKLSEVFKPDDLLLGNLPIFHSFGLLFEVWLLALAPQKTLTLSSPIDIKANLRAIKTYKPTVMIGSPTFFRAYLRNAKREDLKSLRNVIAGAEKTPKGFEQHWNEHFGEGSYAEGYGLTETTPVVGVNLPDRDFGFFSTGKRKGSIGKIFPGMCARILNPSNLEELPFGEQGLISFKGANVFAGYLNNPEATKAALHGEWLVTGDLGRLDSDGFLYVDGRLSRFSKIGGEMVPHATVETALAKALGLDKSELPLLAISSRLDVDKGEAIVLVSAVDLELARVKEALRQSGISNLWMPKYIVRTDKIPLLASGKLDLKTLSDLAKA